MDYTDHYSLLKLGAGEALSANSYEFTDADRDTIDSILYQGATSHRHNGSLSTTTTPTDTLTASLDTLAGSLSPGTQYWWKYTLTEIATGNETAPGPQSTVTTGDAVTSPPIPSAVVATTGGTLTEGTVYYAITAYSGTSPFETLTSGLRNVSIPTGTTTNKVTLNLGSLPSGATGFNIYRRTAGGSGVFFIDSTTSTSYVDTGVAPNCDRTLPFANTTSQVNEVTLCFPGATPTVPAGYTWNLYRTSTEGVWTNSLVTRGIATACYADAGLATSSGQPPSAGLVTQQPSKVLLTDGGEVQGVLPPGLAIYPFEATMAVQGTLSVGTLKDIWTCEYPAAVIKGIRISALGPPASQPIIVDINKNHAGATPVWASIYSSQANRPKLGVGFYVGIPTVPDVTNLIQGDSLTLDIDQDGAASSPTDNNLRVTIYGWAVFTTTTSSSPPWV